MHRFNVLLVRHGKSVWNHDSKFTGWTNIPLIEQGRSDARKIAQTLRSNNIIPTVFFSSVLQRSLESATIIKQSLNSDADILTSWRLNEKHYGTLEGVEREYIRNVYGNRFTSMMRSNFYMKPPVIKSIPQQTEYPIFKNCYFDTIKYGESKENVLTRLLPYFQNDILYTITQDKLPLVVTHKHCLRVIMKHYLSLSDEEFEEFDISSNVILILKFDEDFVFHGCNVLHY
jgi:2,3-bisphosphoglycerate-dependent phosphoglycerate mutase